MRPATDRDRGVTTPLSHALTVGMTAVLLFGLIIGAGSLVDSQNQRAAERELSTIGNRLANEITTADSLAARGGTITMTSTQPDRVGGSGYSVTLHTGTECDRDRFVSETCLRLTASSPDVTVYVPVNNDTTVTLASLDNGRFRIAATDAGPVTVGSTDSAPATNELGATVGVASETLLDSPLDTELGNRPPVSDFEFSPASPQDGRDITFNASGSFDPDGAVDTYRWDWDGDGSIDDTTTDPVVTKSFPAGSYEVTLEVGDENGAKSSFTRLVDVTGLVYNDDLDAVGSGSTVEFTVTNTFSKDVVITHVLADPSDDEVNDTKAINIYASTNGSWSGTKTLYADGRIVALSSSGRLEPGDNATVEINFSESVSNDDLDVGLKYDIGDSVNATRFNETVGVGSLSSYSLVASGPNGQDVDLVLESPVRLDSSTIDVNLSGERNDSLDGSDFTESGSGPYTYEADVVSGTDGFVSANLTTVETDTGEPVLGTPYDENVLVATDGDYVWSGGDDWDNATSSDGVVHAGYGDRDPDQLQLGYTTNDSGLVAYYPLDDPGDAPDESGYGDDNDGTVEGSPSESVGIFGSGGYDLDGTDDYIEVDDSASLEMSDTDEVTVSAWVKLDEIRPGWRAIFQHSDTSYNLHLDDGKNPEFTIYDGTWYSAAAGSSLGPDDWVHLVGTFDGDKARLYVDGTEVDQVSAPNDIDSAGGVNAGLGENVDASGRHLDGSIDEVRVYNRSLSASEVADLNESAFTGEITTDWKNGSSVDFDDAELRYDIDKLPAETVEVTVHANRSGVETSDTLTLSDGAGTTEIDGLSGGNATEYRLEIRLKSPLPDSSPTVRTLEVTAS